MTKHRPQSKTSSLYHLSMNFPTLFQTKPNYLQTNVWKRGSNQFIQQTKKTKANEKPKQKRKRRRSKNNTTVHETIKMKRLEETWDFYWWRRGCLGHPQALTLVLLGYFLGWHAWHPQAWALVHPSSHYSFLPYTWNFSFIQNFTQSLLATLVHSR